MIQKFDKKAWILWIHKLTLTSWILCYRIEIAKIERKGIDLIN